MNVCHKLSTCCNSVKVICRRINMAVYLYFFVCICLGVIFQNVNGFAIKENNTRSSQISFNVSGLMPAVFTALNDDQTINLDVIPAYAEYLIKKGVKNILVGGTSGEHVSLNVDERRKLIASWTDASRSRMYVQAQVGGAPYADVIQLANYSAEIGVDSILVLPDMYTKPKTVEDLVFYIGKVAQAVPKLPVFYYHIPKITNVVISMPAFVKAATASIPNFKGLKFTSNDLVEAAEVLKVLVDDQQLLLGGERLLAPGAFLGIKTFVSPGNNLFPELMESVLSAAKRGDIDQARLLQDKLTSIIDAISEQGGRIPALKKAMGIKTGLVMGPPVLPKKPVTIENEKIIEHIIKKFRGSEEGL